MRIYSILLLLVILISPCSEVASEQMAQESLEGTSGSILLQANQYNVDAIIRAVIGYSYGIGGFHKDTSLAKAWLKPLLALEAMDAYGISALCVDLNEGRLLENLGRSLMHCTMATSSAMATELEQINVFNVKKICLELETKKLTNNNWENEYNKAEQAYKIIERVIHNASRIVRELIHRTAKPEDQYILESSLSIINPSTIPFYINTESCYRKNNKILDIESILSYILTQNDFLVDEKKTYSSSPFISIAASSVIDNIILQDNKEKHIHLINDAHNGNLAAMRTIGNYYLHGISGFPHDTQLAQTWFQSGALEGDAVSMLLVAISYFEGGHLTPAWAFAKVIEDFEGSDDRSKSVASQLKKIIDTKPHKKQIQQQGKDLAIDFFKRSEERMKWRLQNKNL